MISLKCYILDKNWEKRKEKTNAKSDFYLFHMDNSALLVSMKALLENLSARMDKQGEKLDKQGEQLENLSARIR